MPLFRQETKQLVKCQFTVYDALGMIDSFRHKGLRLFFEKDDGSKLQPDMLGRIRIILSALDATETIEGMDLPTFKLHPLKGDLKGAYAVTVRAN